MGILLNGQLLRIGSLLDISSQGYLVKVSLTEEHKERREEVEEHLVEFLDLGEECKVLESSKLVISVSLENKKMKAISEVVGKIGRWEKAVEEDLGIEVCSFVSLMNLEEVFLRYASHQHRDERNLQ